MASKISVPFEKIEGHLDEIDGWLRHNAGQGSSRYSGEKGKVHHWLNGDDWLYFVESVYDVHEDQVPSLELLESNYIFVFRNEEVAVEFALRFA